MHLVDDIHLFPEHCGGVCRFLAYGAYLIDSVVGGGVKLSYIGGKSRVDLPAGVAFKTGTAVHGRQAVQRFCKNFCAACFTSTAGAAEKIGVGASPLRRLVAQNIGYMLLSAYLLKGTGTVFSVQRLMHNPLLSQYRRLRFSAAFDLQRLPRHMNMHMRTYVNIYDKPRGKAIHPKIGRAPRTTPQHPLGTGNPAAHQLNCLMLLGSPPDMVHSRRLRRDPSFNTDIYDTDCAKPNPQNGIPPLRTADFRLRRPLSSRLV